MPGDRRRGPFFIAGRLHYRLRRGDARRRTAENGLWNLLNLADLLRNSAHLFTHGRRGPVGEVVVTTFNPDYPMIRLATGDLSAVLAGRSPCGRTNARIKGWMGRADQTTKVKGMFVRPEQIAELAKRHPALGRLRLVVTRDGEQDAMTLHAEAAQPDASLSETLATSLQSVTKLKGAVKVVEPGTLANDGKVIADERSLT